MSAIGEILAALRQVFTMEQRIATLTQEVAEMKAREQDTRERLIRLETIIDEARRTAARRLPKE